MRKRLQRENFAPRRFEQLPHVLFTLLEAAPGNAGHHLVSRPLQLAPAAHAESVEMLDTRYFVPGGAVVLGKLGLYDDLRIEFIRDDEVGSLLEAVHSLGALGLAEGDAMAGQKLLDRGFEDVADEFAHRIPVAGEAKEPFIQ